MAKRCGFCAFTSEDETAFAEHMRTVHGWGSTDAGAVAPSPAVAPDAEELAEAKFCGNCGAPRDAASTKFCRNCGVPFAGASTTVSEPRASLAFAPKGGFWRRTGAYLIDAVLLLILGAIIGLLLGVAGLAARFRRADIDVISQLVGGLLGLAYFLFFWSARGEGQTPGMRALGLRVIRTDGTFIGVGRAFLRYIGLALSTLALFIGLIWVAFDKNRQGWHDKIADTYVIRTSPG